MQNYPSKVGKGKNSSTDMFNYFQYCILAEQMLMEGTKPAMLNDLYV